MEKKLSENDIGTIFNFSNLYYSLDNEPEQTLDLLLFCGSTATTTASVAITTTTTTVEHLCSLSNDLENLLRLPENYVFMSVVSSLDVFAQINKKIGDKMEENSRKI